MQITIDGPKENHDLLRPYINGSFEDVLSSLKRGLDCCKQIVLRVNVDETNEGSIQSLLDYLKDEGLYSQKNLVLLDFTS